MRIKQVIGPVLTVLLASLFLLLGPTAVPINAQINSTWKGGTGDWSNAANWNPAEVPNNIGLSTTYHVTINVPGSFVTMDVLNDTIVSLSLGGSDSLSINSSASLSLLNGANSFGTLTNSGNLLNEGTVNNAGNLDNITEHND